MRTKVARTDRVYLRALAREGRFWKGQESDPGMPNMLHPVLQRYKDECETGSDRFTYLKAQGPFKRGLSIGCGSGNVEVALMKRGIVEHFDFIDVSQESLDALQHSLSTELRARSRIMLQDLNFLQLDEKYDFIFCANVLHHLINLEHILLELNDALSPEGILFVDDFVGENRFQFSDERIAMINSIGQLAHARTGVGFTPLSRTGRRALINSCPFEAVRSEDILPLLEELFSKYTVRQCSYGAVSSWANVVLSNKKGLDDALAIFVQFDKFIMERNLLPPLYLSGIFRRNPKPPMWRVRKWSPEELKFHLPVRPIDERHVLALGNIVARGMGRGRLYNGLKKTYMRFRG